MPHENEIGSEIIDAAIQIHRNLGPGLLETVYEVVLARELEKRGLSVTRQVSVPIEYDGIRFDEGFRADMIVDDRVIIEQKSTEKLLPVHKKQLLTYLRLRHLTVGYLLNFSAALMKDGICRVIDGTLSEQPGNVSHGGTKTRRKGRRATGDEPF